MPYENGCYHEVIDLINPEEKFEITGDFSLSRDSAVGGYLSGYPIICGGDDEKSVLNKCTLLGKASSKVEILKGSY